MTRYSSKCGATTTRRIIAICLARVRDRLPEAALGSDIIVGFPGESDAQFENSLEYFNSLPLTYFHVFPYSSRRGTAAASSRESRVPGR